VEVHNYSLFRVKYFILAYEVVYSTVVAKTAEEAEEIVENCPEIKKHSHGNISAIMECTRLHAVTHISPDLLLELFPSPFST
jgi:hypothetical protein